MLGEIIEKTEDSKKTPLATTQSLSVLVIEDSESDVFLIQSMLEEVSPDITFNIKDAPRLVDAFKIVKREKFDIILLDLNLLDIQGVASVAALHAEIPNTPIIVYSGMDDPKLRRESLLCGAQYYLVKGKQTSGSLKYVIENVLSTANG